MDFLHLWRGVDTGIIYKYDWWTSFILSIHQPQQLFSKCSSLANWKSVIKQWSMKPNFANWSLQSRWSPIVNYKIYSVTYGHVTFCLIHLTLGNYFMFMRHDWLKVSFVSNRLSHVWLVLHEKSIITLDSTLVRHYIK